MPLKEGFGEKNYLQCCDLTLGFGSSVNKLGISDKLFSEVTRSKTSLCLRLVP